MHRVECYGVEGESTQEQIAQDACVSAVPENSWLSAHVIYDKCGDKIDELVGNPVMTHRNLSYASRLISVTLLVADQAVGIA